MPTTNLLILLSDEHNARVMGCAGHPIVRTPHLDELARQGTRFENAYTASPICVPARASIATGRYVHQHRCWDNAIAYTGEPASWGHRLQSAGVRVESIGKLHYRNEADPTGFDRQQLAAHIMDGIGQVWGSVREPLPDPFPTAPLFKQIGAGESSYNRFDQSVAGQAAQWLQERAEDEARRPWVLFVGFVAPHFPLIVPQRYLDLYPVADMPLPKLHPDSGYRRHPWVERHARFSRHDEQLSNDDRRRLALASYFGLTSFMDEQVGLVLQALAESGLVEDTTVVYSSDHGDNLGARGLWNKCTLYREAVAVPMIVKGPEIPAGRTVHTNVSLVDLFPTVLDAAGVAPHAEDADLPGVSLRHTAVAGEDPDRLAFSEYHAVGSESAGYMLADGRYKYHYYVGHPPEFFDLHDDPEETRDLAASPEHAEILAAFEHRLRQLVDPEAADRLAKDDQQALIARFGGREAALRTGTPGATPVPAA
ncbi:sulfatase-like hydrolase/transferase [Verticiella sediminum]|uniref:Sulfatase-like hydrolase/transferase n=1 Tax=Verticiella sediminum TaxID=1247510 RepID=A0A556AWN1_9BURK|nr:sulfatase-like hydrolase/transferase [Verticiella sediminum]TSH97363.1 sulfatase-like hydrolase/transferase [Verticiella sediminum]